TLDSGCCGMAGSFGYEQDHYDLSMKIGERVLLPAVRQASEDSLIIANGFSCRSQIRHGSERRALHLVEVMQMALRERKNSTPGSSYPEAHLEIDQERSTLKRGVLLASLAAGVLTLLLAFKGNKTR